jgi:S1-C subfamily serine protease
MNDSTLVDISNRLADAVAAIAPSVVQVQGRRRPASGVVYAPDVVLTTARALGRDNGVRVRTGAGVALDAELAGWDPATGLVVLRASGLETAPATLSETPARVGHLAIAVARSWSNAVTASAGIVSVIGGPLPTGRGRVLDEVIRTSAPMHEGFAGGAFVDVSGRLAGVTTASAIRGLGVVIPASIAWKTAATLLEHGTLKRGYLGVAGQPVHLGERQRAPDRPAGGLLIVAVTSGSPADTAGVLVGDIVVAFDGHGVESPDDLLELLLGDRVGRSVPVRILRGETVHDLTVTVGERPAS